MGSAGLSTKLINNLWIKGNYKNDDLESKARLRHGCFRVFLNGAYD